MLWLRLEKWAPGGIGAVRGGPQWSSGRSVRRACDQKTLVFPYAIHPRTESVRSAELLGVASFNVPGTLIYVHIPKTAGTTMRQVLRSAVGEDFYLVRGGPDRDVRDAAAEFRDLPPERRRTVRALMGHVPYGAHEWLEQESCYATMLRDPVERIVSMYYYIRSGAKESSAYSVQDMSLAEFATSPPVANASNAHVRFLAGRQDWGQVTNFEPVTRRDVELAKRHLGTFAAVGLTSRFDESVNVIARQMGWSVSIPAPRRVTPGRPQVGDLSPTELEAVRRACAPDYDLYDYALDLFERQHRDASATTKR